VRSLRPDVKLVDIELDDEDGVELAQRLYDISAVSSKVIFVLTHAAVSRQLDCPLWTVCHRLCHRAGFAKMSCRTVRCATVCP